MSTQQLSMVLEARQFAQRVQDKLDTQFLEEVSSKSTRARDRCCRPNATWNGLHVEL
jgi:hypothetical protein